MTPAQAERLLMQASRSFPSLPFAGQGDVGAMGPAFTIHPEFWVVAKITEQPSRSDDEEDDWPGYSWIEQISQPLGEWADPDEDLEGGLVGDNGSTSGIINSPCFALDGDESIEVDTLVLLVRGYQHDGGESEDSQGQEWTIVSSAAATTKTPRVHITGRPFRVSIDDDEDNDILVYPAVRDLDDATGTGYHDGTTDLWVVQRDGAYLDTRGFGHYEASLKLKSYTVPDCDDEDDTRDLWVTTECIMVVGWNETTCKPIMSGEFEGEAICDTLTHGGEAILHHDELIGVG